jgi:hypothetical protein
MNRKAALVLIALSLTALLACLVLSTGRTRPGDYPISTNCVWVEDNSRPLNLDQRADRTHLRRDAVTAEDVAIRWADKYYGHLPEYEPRRNECMETLFAGVAKHHSVDVALVRQYSVERDEVADSAVVLTFAVLYVLAGYVFAGRIYRRFSTAEPGFWVMTFTLAVGISLVGLMIGNLWSLVIEGLRLNSGHISYRMDRIPFRQHWGLLFVCGFVIFVLATLVRARFRSDEVVVERLRITVAD